MWFEWRDRASRDMPLFILSLLLLFSGLLILYSASAVISWRLTGTPDFYFTRQIAWAGIGIVALLLSLTFPLRYLRTLSLPFILVNIALLVLVFVPGVGHAVHSSRDSFHRWIGIGEFTFQPSELAKVAIVIYAAHILARLSDAGRIDLSRLLAPGAIIGAVLVLIVIEPQYGTTVSLLGVLGLMLFIAGFPMKRLVLIGLAALPLLFLLIWFWEYRLERLRVWLDPFAYRHEGGYQLVTAFRAFSNGGWGGSELASGFAHRYLTFGHTDFVLALLAEDFGFVGVFSLLLLYALFFWRGVALLRRVSEPFPFYLGCGALIALILQALLNASVVTGLVPTTGISLPFVSYGGSSLVVSLTFAGLLVNVSRYARDYGEGNLGRIQTPAPE